MLKKRTLSIISEIIVICAALFFVVNALSMKPAKHYYESPALYPLLVSAALIIASLVALFQDLFGKNKEDDSVISIPNMKGFIVAFGIIILMKLIWQIADLYYIAVFIGVWLMLYCFHDIDKTKKQRLVIATAGSLIFTVIAYILFTVLLTIRF